MSSWLKIFAQTFIKQVAPEQQGALIAKIVERLRPVLQDTAGKWTADYVRLRFQATALP